VSELNAQRRRFVEEYVKLGNAAAAARAAGYSEHTARQQGSRLLSDADVRAAIEERREALYDELGITQHRIIQGMYDVAERSMQDVPVTDEDGPTGEYVFAGRTALAAWKELAKLRGMYPADRHDIRVGGALEFTVTMGKAIEPTDDSDGE
jgi:hypothetical protein